MLDLLLDAFVQAAGSFIEWTTRGLVLTVSILSLVLGGLTCWLILAFTDPLVAPEWGFGAIAGCFAVGGMGLALSLFRLVREATDELEAYVCVLTNAAVVLLPTVWLMTR